MNLEYKDKYLKYKTKYINLKNQMAGASTSYQSPARKRRLDELRSSARKMSEEQGLTKEQMEKRKENARIKYFKDNLLNRKIDEDKVKQYLIKNSKELQLSSNLKWRGKWDKYNEYSVGDIVYSPRYELFIGIRNNKTFFRYRTYDDNLYKNMTSVYILKPVRGRDDQNYSKQSTVGEISKVKAYKSEEWPAANNRDWRRIIEDVDPILKIVDDSKFKTLGEVLFQKNSNSEELKRLGELCTGTKDSYGKAKMLSVHDKKFVYEGGLCKYTNKLTATLLAEPTVPLFTNDMQAIAIGLNIQKMGKENVETLNLSNTSFLGLIKSGQNELDDASFHLMKAIKGLNNLKKVIARKTDWPDQFQRAIMTYTRQNKTIDVIMKL